MPKVYGIHHTQLDSLSVAPYDVRTLFGINGGPLEMASDFFPPSLFLAHSCLKIATGRKLHNWSKFYVYQLSQHHTLPDVAQSHSEIPQTPSRFPRGTTIYGTFWPIQGNWEKRKQPLKMCLNGCLSIAYHTPPDSIKSHSHLSDTPQTASRYPPDTFQTPEATWQILTIFCAATILILWLSTMMNCV